MIRRENRRGASIVLFIAALFLAFTFATPFTHADITSHLVGYWALNETSSNQAADSSGSGNTGTITGTADWVSGKIGNALNFDGSTYFDVSRPVQDDFTICAWFKTSGVGGGDAHFDLMQIADSEIAGTSVGDFGFGIDSVGRLAYGSGGGGTSDSTVVRTTGAVNDGAWHHGCVTRNATTGDAKLYLDGSLVDSGTWVTGSLNGNSTLRIGGFQDGGSSGKNFVGLLDDVRTYSSVLDASSITDIYQFNPSSQQAAVSVSVAAGLPWCSGPMAPGWSVNLPDGGCSNNVTPALVPMPPVAALTASAHAAASSGSPLLELEQQLVLLLTQELSLLMQRS